MFQKVQVSSRKCFISVHCQAFTFISKETLRKIHLCRLSKTAEASLCDKNLQLFNNKIVQVNQSQFMYLKCGGSSLIDKKSGHTPNLEDLNTVTPSVLSLNDMLNGCDKNPPCRN